MRLKKKKKKKKNIWNCEANNQYCCWQNGKEDLRISKILVVYVLEIKFLFAVSSSLEISILLRDKIEACDPASLNQEKRLSCQ